jgi:hypothetical protein
MAKSTEPKVAAPKATAPKPAAAKAPEPKLATKAQAEFERYKSQGGAAEAPFGFAATQDQPAVMYPVMLPYPGKAGLGWAFPPSVAMLQHPPGSGGMHAAAAQRADGSLADQLGSTLRLGIDAVNAVLAGGIRVLTGFSGYGSEHAEPHGCSCGSCCDPCESECGGYDCCCAFGESCCQPSVGTCC